MPAVSCASTVWQHAVHCFQSVSRVGSAGKHGWPTSTVVPGVPETEEDQATLVDVLQAWKTQHYQDLVGARQPADAQTVFCGDR